MCRLPRVPGAILSVEDRLNISGNAVFSWNTAGQRGGAIAVAEPLNLSIVGATFTSNWIVKQYTTPSGGGAVWLDSVGKEVDLYLEDLVFDNNSAILMEARCFFPHHPLGTPTFGAPPFTAILQVCLHATGIDDTWFRSNLMIHKYQVPGM